MPEAKKVISALTTAGTNITDLVPYTGFDFLSEQIAIALSGSGPAIKSLAPDGVADVYPGNNPSSGDLKFTRDLYPGEVIVMSVANSVYHVKAGVTYDNPTKLLRAKVHLEKNGLRVLAPTSAHLRIMKDGSLVKNLGTQSTVDALGIFTFEDSTLTLARNEMYDLDVTVTMPEGPITATQQLVNY
jgi:hypothetical protein